MVNVCLLIFSGSHVESSFSLISNIIDKQSNCMNIDTYNDTMTIKFTLKQVLIYIDVLIYYMIPLTKKCAISALLIQDARKWWIRTSWRKKSVTSHGVKVLTGIFQKGNLNILNLLKTQTKTRTVKEASDNNRNFIKNDNTLNGRSSVQSQCRIYTCSRRVFF